MSLFGIDNKRKVSSFDINFCFQVKPVPCTTTTSEAGLISRYGSHIPCDEFGLSLGYFSSPSLPPFFFPSSLTPLSSPFSSHPYPLSTLPLPSHPLFPSHSNPARRCEECCTLPPPVDPGGAWPRMHCATLEPRKRI